MLDVSLSQTKPEFWGSIWTKSGLVASMMMSQGVVLVFRLRKGKASEV